MNTLSQEKFNHAVNACRNYDPFTQYIDSYRQQEQAEESNRCYDKWFIEIMLSAGVECYGVPFECQNAGEQTESKLIKWLAENGVEVEQSQPKPKRVWTEEQIKHLIQTNDEVLYDALKKLYECQTADEKTAGHTKVYNGKGFNGVDSVFLSSVSEFLLKRGFLTDKQKYIVRKKLVKYNKQLTKIANA